MSDPPGIGAAPPAEEAPPVIELPQPRPHRRGGVRRKALNPRVAHLHLRATPARKAEIRTSAKTAGMTVTEYLLSHLPGSGTVKPKPIFTADPLILVRLLAELGKWGGNWNQLARDRNMTGREPESEELRLIREALTDIRAELFRALGREH